ncbi:MAG: hypothetical protein OXG84_11015 [Chloroflexi bacterium]|nr:hypothetical protein [Chloroflexota bacterium]
MTRALRKFCIALFMVAVVSVSAQTLDTQRAACDTTDRRRQSRFYQRGFPPDDQTDDALWRYSDLEA